VAEFHGRQNPPGHLEKTLSEGRYARLGTALAAVGYLAVLLCYANSAYPKVGHDFAYFIPRLLDSHLHYAANGLAIQWYTPTFGGGLPAYPNPQDTQFTLAQLYLALADPWIAGLAAAATYILLGFLCAYYFFERILRFRPMACALGSVFFGSNGFVFAHIVAGHVGYQAFPLFPALLIAIAHPGWPAPIKGISIAVIFSILIHSGGFYVIVIFALSALLLLPFTQTDRFRILQPKRLLAAAGWALPFTLALSGSKICAIGSFMRFFPRIEQDHYLAGPWRGLYSMFLQFLGPAVTVPGMRLAGKSISSYVGHIQDVSRTNGIKMGIWEYDAGLSPALLVLLAVGCIGLFRWLPWRKGRALAFDPRKLILCGLGLVCVWIAVEFRLAQGLIYPHLQSLPILASLHVNLRFASAFLFPLSFLGAWVFERRFASVSAAKRGAVFGGLLAISIAAPAGYFAISPIWYAYTYDVLPSVNAYREIRRGERFPIRSLCDSSGQTGSNPLVRNASDLYPYEPIFGYDLEAFDPETHPGPVADREDGYFNMSNPAGLVFPEVNHSRLFERIRESDSVSVRLFVNHHQPDWKRPALQRGLDFIMPLAAALSLILLAGYFGRKGWGRLKQGPGAPQRASPTAGG
jgi:hypothetical protein